jgi:gliding motility associated protien GldN
MNRVILIAFSTLLIGSVSAQDWGGGWGSTEPAATQGKSKKTTASVNVNAKGKGSATATVTTPQPNAVAAPAAAVAIIGIHYNDTAKAHYEPEYVNQDTNLTLIEGEFVPRPYLRHADIKFSRRVWRIIDLRQKLNKSWTWPRNPVTQIFWDLGTKGLCRAYYSDSFRSLITPEGIMASTSETESVPVLNADVDINNYDASDESNYHDSLVPIIFKWNDIRKFEIMEDWVFDYKHGEMKPIIIGIAPVRDKKMTINGVTISSPQKPFWLKMDDCRPTLAKSQVFNRYNDAMRLNWDQHINVHRLFDSYIVKTTDFDNAYLAEKNEYREDPVALLLESDKIKNDLFIFEHDLWEY